MNKKIKLLLIVLFFIGIFILLYPLISQYWNSKVQSKTITNYDNFLKETENVDYTDMFDEGESYNKKLSKLEFPLTQYKMLDNYNNLFNINNDGMIGYITIDKIKVELPIYHGTSSSVLNVAVGHLKGTSLPIGGKSTHSVLSAHRGLPTSKLFTNLNKLEIGDSFVITVIDKKITYQVDKIIIVEPTDIIHLKIEKNKDYVTLMTCTPYGLNTHRLLIRGTRIENVKEIKIIVTSDAYQIDKMTVTILISLPIILFLITIVMIKPVKKKIYKKEEV